jgi:hypothetical protein
MITRSMIINYGILVVFALLSFALCNPKPKHNLTQTFQQVSQVDAFDTARQLKWIYLDSFLPTLEAARSKVQQETPTCVVTLDTQTALRLSVPAGCESAFNPAFLGVYELQRYCKMAPYPIKAVQSGHGFECPIVTKNGRRAVWLPVDILQSVVKKAGGQRGVMASTRAVARPRAAVAPRAAAPPRAATAPRTTAPAKPKKKK